MTDYKKMAAGVCKALDERGIAYETREGEDSAHVTIWNHNGYWITYDAFTMDDGRTQSGISVGSAFTEGRRDVDAEVVARIIEAVS